jgi:hypothetical protein
MLTPQISTAAFILSLIFMGFAIGSERPNFGAGEWDNVQTRENDLRTSLQAARQAVADQKETARQADVIGSRYGESHRDTKRYRDVQSQYDHMAQKARQENTDAKNHYG